MATTPSCWTARASSALALDGQYRDRQRLEQVLGAVSGTGSSFADGIHARTDGSGTIATYVNGNVSGEHDGVHANANGIGNVSVTTECHGTASTSACGVGYGIARLLRRDGSSVTVNMNGNTDVGTVTQLAPSTAGAKRGINAVIWSGGGATTNVNVTTGPNATISAYFDGIDATNRGFGDTDRHHRR